MEVGKIFFEIMILIKKVLYFFTYFVLTNFQKSDARSFEKNVEIFFEIFPRIIIECQDFQLL